MVKYAAGEKGLATLWYNAAMQQKPLLVLFDGNGLIHRAFHALPQFTVRKTAEPVGQFGRARELVQAFNIPIYELAGFEADDVLGTLSKQAAAEGMDTVIVTGDADMMQSWE